MAFIDKLNEVLSEGDDKEVKLSPPNVLYLGPNPDGSRKSCGNCFMWVKEENRCILFKKDVKVTKDMICSYHVYGEPQGTDRKFDIPPIDPKLAGLDTVKGGTSCDTCVAFKDGYCQIVYDKSEHAKVDPKGCCSMWKAK